MSASSSPNETRKAPGADSTAKTADATALYSVRNLHKEYQMPGVKVPVLRGCDLEVRHGEILAIIGMSGVGKTTLLNIMGLLDNPTSGELIYNSGADDSLRNCDLANLQLNRKCSIRNQHFGFVFQFYHLQSSRSVPASCSIGSECSTAATSLPRASPAESASGWPSPGLS